MGVKEFYDSVGGDYNEVFAQIGDDEVIKEFIYKFFEKNEMKNLKELIEKKKFKDGFICVHNMKGYGLNMALPVLHKAACNLCEQLRNGKPKINIKPLMDDLENAYNLIKTSAELNLNKGDS